MSNLRDLFGNLEESERHQLNARRRDEKEPGSTPLTRWAREVGTELEGAKAWAISVNETLAAGVDLSEAHHEAFKILDATIKALESRIRALEGR